MTGPGPFEKVSINGMTLANRFVRSATREGLASQEHAVTPKLTEMMVELARGEVGLIISGCAFVSPEGQSGRGQLAVYDDRFVAGLRGMVEAVHAAGGKIALQIVHCGRFAKSALTGLRPIGPCSVATGDQITCRAMNQEDITNVVSAFARAAFRARQAGFDAVQVHAAHGYLLSQFLSPALNPRSDDYGGALVNRARLLIEVVRRIREATGPAYPLLVKLNSEDFIPGGLTRDEAVEIAAMLEAASVDGIELSGGTALSPEQLQPPRPGKWKTPEGEVYYLEAARLCRQRVGLPLLLVGGIRSIETAERLVRDGVTDFISLSRPLICEPGLVKRWREGDRRRSECASCNSCFAAASDGRGVYCVTREKKRANVANKVEN